MSYTRLMLHEMYTAPSIELAFLGASPVYRGFNTKISDTLLERETFNLGSSDQQFVGSYYLLRETIKNHDLKTVILHVSYKSFTGTDSSIANEILIKYFKPSINRQMFGKDALDTFFYSPAVYMHGTGIDAKRTPQDAFDTLNIKLTDKAYRQYSAVCVPEKLEQYEKKGYVARDTTVAPGTIPIQINGFTICQDTAAEFWMRKTIELCKKKGIEVIMVSVPYSDVCVLDLSDRYDDWQSFITRIASEYDVPYWDFNLTDSRYLPADDSCYYDAFHMNRRGATRFTELFSDVMLDYEQGIDVNSVYFLPSASARIAQCVSVRAVKIAAERTENGFLIDAAVIQRGDLDVTYKFVFQDEETVLYTRDYCTENVCAFTHPTCNWRVTCYVRRVGSTEEYDAMATVKAKDLLSEVTGA